MKWRNWIGERDDEAARKMLTLNTPRKHFAWWPTDVGNNTVWMENYYKVYTYFPRSATSCGYHRDINHLVGDFDIERMKQALSGDSITIPSGLTREEMREFILRSAE